MPHGIKQSAVWQPDTYQLADIARVHPKDWSRIEAKASELVFTPHVKWLHHFLIGQYLADENDYVIYESIPSHGVAIGRLSWYDGYEYSVLRLNRPDSAQIGAKVIEDVSLFGRRPYGYGSMFGLIRGLISVEYDSWKVTHRLKAITSFEMQPYMSNTGLLCTQLVVDAYLKAKVAILPLGAAALPCAFEGAIEDGTLIEV